MTKCSRIEMASHVEGDCVERKRLFAKIIKHPSVRSVGLGGTFGGIVIDLYADTTISYTEMTAFAEEYQKLIGAKTRPAFFHSKIEFTRGHDDQS